MQRIFGKCAVVIPYASFDYDALELSVVQGEMVDVLEEKLGWALCKNSQNNIGWVPLRVFG